MKFLANYYDGLRSTATEVEVTLDHNVLRFQIGVNNLEFTGPAFSIQPALGKASRIIELNNGGRLEFEHLILKMPALVVSGAGFISWKIIWVM